MAQNADSVSQPSSLRLIWGGTPTRAGSIVAPSPPENLAAKKNFGRLIPGPIARWRDDTIYASRSRPGPRRTAFILAAAFSKRLCEQRILATAQTCSPTRVATRRTAFANCSASRRAASYAAVADSNSKRSSFPTEGRVK